MSAGYLGRIAGGSSAPGSARPRWRSRYETLPTIALGGAAAAAEPADDAVGPPIPVVSAPRAEPTRIEQSHGTASFRSQVAEPMAASRLMKPRAIEHESAAGMTPAPRVVAETPPATEIRVDTIVPNVQPEHRSRAVDADRVRSVTSSSDSAPAPLPDKSARVTPQPEPRARPRPDAERADRPDPTIEHRASATVEVLVPPAFGIVPPAKPASPEAPTISAVAGVAPRRHAAPRASGLTARSDDAPPTTVVVTIGRVEIRAATPTPTPSAPRRQAGPSPMSLDAYLSRREREAR